MAGRREAVVVGLGAAALTTAAVGRAVLTAPSGGVGRWR
jgi:hypothetical protein